MYRPKGFNDILSSKTRHYSERCECEFCTGANTGADAYEAALKKEPVTVIRVNDCVVGYLVYIPEEE